MNFNHSSRAITFILKYFFDALFKVCLQHFYLGELLLEIKNPEGDE